MLLITIAILSLGLRLSQANIANRGDQKCVQKTPNIRYGGSWILVVKKIDNVDQCITTCLNSMSTYKKECKSANYLISTQTCQIMDMVLDPTSESNIRVYAKADPDSIYISVVCAANGQPLASPQLPTPAPVGRPIPTGTCGQNAFDIRGTHQRIVGGSEANKHSFPWIASLSRYNLHYCGGSLIRVSPDVEESDIIITAAHCVEDRRYQISAQLGAHTVNGRQEGTEMVEVDKIVLHPDLEDRVVNDIAILKLKKPVKFGAWIQPVCLPKSGDMLPEDMSFIAAGWGKTSGYGEEGGKMSDILLQTIIPGVNHEECAQKFREVRWPFLINRKIMLCAGVLAGGTGVCVGDSGGPLIGKGQNGYILHGVVSFGKGCARPGWPDVFARVSAYVDWINEEVKNLSSVYASG